MFTPIRWRLVGWAVLILGLILVAVAFAGYLTLSRTLVDGVDRNLSSRGEDLARNLHEFSDGDLTIGRAGYRGGLFYLVVDPTGTLVANPQSVDVPRLEVNASSGTVPYFGNANISGESSRLYIRPLTTGGQTIAFLIVGQSLADVQAALNRLLLVLILSGVAGLLLSLLGGWFLAGRALIPIQIAFNRQQQFVADASHELRTPLTILRSTADLLNQHRSEVLDANGDLFDGLRQEIASLERLAGDLLTLARSDLGAMTLEIGRLDVAGISGEVVRRTLPLARARQVELTMLPSVEPLPIEADPDRLQQVLLILLDNALKHTSSGGAVKVTAARQGDFAVLQVKDNGEGISAEHLLHVFDRFYRADRSRSDAGGSGLGLAIARSIVEAHGGVLSLSSIFGAGTTATIRLPLVRHAHSLASRVTRLAARVAHR